MSEKFDIVKFRGTTTQDALTHLEWYRDICSVESSRVTALSNIPTTKKNNEPRKDGGCLVFEYE